MTPEQLEYSISQYIDGTLSPLERDALDEQLATDPAARALLEEYRSLNAIVKTDMPRGPAIDWDQLGRRIGDAVAREPSPAGRTYQLAWVRSVQRIAIAACILMVFGLGIQSYRSHVAFQVSGPAPAPPLTGVSIVMITGPQEEAPSGAVVAQIAIGPAPSVDEFAWRYADSGVVARPQVVLIDRAYGPAQDMNPMPY